MSDRRSYLEAGIKYSWSVTYTSGEVVKEFNSVGKITKLSEVDWDRVVKFSANILGEKNNGEDDKLFISIPYSKEYTPVWFHRSFIVVVGENKEKAYPLLTFIGIETDSDRILIRLNQDYSCTLLLEKPAD